jgi:hypothetical protein
MQSEQTGKRFTFNLFRLNDLLGGDGLAILESGLSFGAGCLHNFGLNSNTSANGFIKCLYKKVTVEAPKPKLDQQKVMEIQRKMSMLPEGSPERKKLKDMLKCGLEEGNDSESSDGEEGSGPVGPPPKTATVDYQALAPFKDLYKHSPIIQMAFEFGPSCIPLSAVGMILNFTGNHLLHYIYTVYRKRIFFPMHKVVAINLMSNGEIVTTAIRSECSITCEPSDAC